MGITHQNFIKILSRFHLGMEHWRMTNRENHGLFGCSLLALLIGVSMAALPVSFGMRLWIVFGTIFFVFRFTRRLYLRRNLPWTQRSRFTLFFLVTIFMSLGYFRYTLFENKPAPLLLDRQNDKKEISLVGKIVSIPDRQEKETQFIFKTEVQEDSVKTVSSRDDSARSSATKEKSVRILVSVPVYENYLRSTPVTISGIVHPVEKSRSPFDYGAYFAKDHISYKMVATKIAPIPEQSTQNLFAKLFGKSFSIGRSLDSVRYYFVQKIDQLLPDPESGLLRGILFGDKHALSKQLQNEFARVGTIHIIALSGYNVTIIAVAMMAMMSRLPRKLAIVLGAIGMTAFVIMTGASATGVRSLIMGLVALLAKFSGENYSAKRALGVAIMIMVLINPWLLLSDISFELSALATAGLLYLVPYLKKYFYWVTPRLELRETVTTTLAAEISVLPLVLIRIGSISIIGLPMNLLTLPAIPFVMLSGVIALAISSIWLPLGQIAAFPVYLGLHYVVVMTQIAAKFSFAAISI